MATSLAQWTAKKDYFEFCESVSPSLSSQFWTGFNGWQHDWQLPGCDVIRDQPPGPPPALDPRGTRAAEPQTERPELYIENSLGLPAVYLVFLAAGGIVVSSRSRSFRQHLRKLARSLMQPQPDEFPTRAILSPSPALVDFQPGLGQEHASSTGPLPISFGTSSSFEFSFGSSLPASLAVTTAIDDSGNSTLRQRNTRYLDVSPPLPPPKLTPIRDDTFGGLQSLAKYTDVVLSLIHI